MKQALGSRILAFCLASIVTLTLAGGLDALAATRQSATAVLAQHATLQTACGNATPAPRI